jgi:hypothetical protein
MDHAKYERREGEKNFRRDLDKTAVGRSVLKAIKEWRNWTDGRNNNCAGNMVEQITEERKG